MRRFRLAVPIYNYPLSSAISDDETHCTRKPLLADEIVVTFINTFSNGCLGSHNDEERSEMRYVMRIATLSESSKFWTQLALPFTRKYVCWSVCSSPLLSPFLGKVMFIVGSTVWSVEDWICLDEISNSPVLSLSHWRDVMSFLDWEVSPAFCLISYINESVQCYPIGPPISQDYPLNLSI